MADGHVNNQPRAHSHTDPFTGLPTLHNNQEMDVFALAIQDRPEMAAAVAHMKELPIRSKAAPES